MIEEKVKEMQTKLMKMKVSFKQKTVRNLSNAVSERETLTVYSKDLRSVLCRLLELVFQPLDLKIVIESSL